MKKIWLKRFNSFEQAGKADDLYYLNMSPAERLDIMQFLREIYIKLRKGKSHESGQRLRRAVKIFQQA